MSRLLDRESSSMRRSPLIGSKQPTPQRRRSLPNTAKFGDRSIFIRVADRGQTWRLYPGPPSLEECRSSGFRQPWDMTGLGSRARLAIPAPIHRATKIKAGAMLVIFGQKTYLEVWDAQAWERFRKAIEGRRLAEREFDASVQGARLGETYRALVYDGGGGVGFA